MEIVQMEQKIEIPRDGNGAPWVVPPEGGRPIRLTRTTTFVDGMEDKTNIVNWKTRCVAWASRQPECRGIMEEIETLDPVGDIQDKRKMNALVEALMDKAGLNDKRERGTYLHALTELADAGIPLPETTEEVDRERIRLYVKKTALFTMRHIEQFGVIPELKVGGTPDRTASYMGPGPNDEWFDSDDDGDLIVDVKTGNVEYGLLKMAGQLGVYKKARRYDPSKYPILPVLNKRTHQPRKDPDGKLAMAEWKKTEHEPVEGAYSSFGNINSDWGVIVHLPSTGEPQCDLHWLNLEYGWRVAEEAVRLRELRSEATKSHVMFPFEGSKPMATAELTTVTFGAESDDA